MATAKKRKIGKPVKRRRSKADIEKEKQALVVAKQRKDIMKALRDGQTYLPATTVDRMKAQIDELDRESAFLAKWYKGDADGDTIRTRNEKRKQLQTRMEAGRPPEVSDAVKNQLYGIYKEKREVIERDMIPEDQMMGKRCNRGKGRKFVPSTVEQQEQFLRKHEADIELVKNIATIIDPHNPELRRVESWRREH